MYLWNYFAELSEFRDGDSFAGSPKRLKPADILAWSKLMKIPLELFEIEIIVSLDRLFLKCKAEETAQAPKGKA